MTETIKADFHTHTTYCDGKNSVSDMFEAAKAAGMEAIGFSGHSHTPFDESYCMSDEETKKYIDEINGLKRSNDSSTEVYLGLEKDRFSDVNDTSDFDYVIGSVHYVLKDGCYLPVDESPELFRSNIDKYYGGDIYAFCGDYFSLAASFAGDDDVSIIGHFDLVTKFNEGNALFDTGDKRYISAADGALKTLADAGKILEINTGAMSRGYRTEPYPSKEILKKWRSLNGKIIFSGDAHSAESLCFAFDVARKTALECGFESALVIRNGRFAKIPLKN